MTKCVLSDFLRRDAGEGGMMGKIELRLSNNGMTWAWLVSKPGQKPFSTSKFTDSWRSNLLPVCAHRTGRVNKDSCIRFECAHMPAWVCAHTSVWGRVIVYVGQRLNKGGKCVCLTLVISLNTQTEVRQVLVKLMQPCFLPFVGRKKHICGQKHTRAAQEHTHHHCHTFHSEI